MLLHRYALLYQSTNEFDGTTTTAQQLNLKINNAPLPFLAPTPTLLCREPSRSELERKRHARAAHPGAGARQAHSPKKNVFAAPAQVKRARRNGLAMGHEKALVPQ